MDKTTFEAIEHLIDLVREAFPRGTPKEADHVETWLRNVRDDVKLQNKLNRRGR